jgi:hypothetical protein
VTKLCASDDTSSSSSSGLRFFDLRDDDGARRFIDAAREASTNPR